MCLAGGYVDHFEVKWIKEVRAKSFEELADSGPGRVTKCDIALNKAMVSLINGTNEPLKNDLALKERDAFNDDKSLMGRQVVWMVIGYFETNRALGAQHSWEDISKIKWRGDEHIYDTYCHWNLILGGIVVEIPEVTQIEAFLNIFRPSKKLAPDIHEFERTPRSAPFAS